MITLQAKSLKKKKKFLKYVTESTKEVLDSAF